MSRIGCDVGTSNLVVSTRDEQGNFVFKKEMNAFLELPLEHKFVFNMLKNCGVPMILRQDKEVAYALGQASAELAYTMPQITLRRPMENGVVNPHETSSFEILNIMIHSLIGEIDKDTILYYCIPSATVNSDNDVTFHARLLDKIFKAYKSETGHIVKSYSIPEGLALIYAELKHKMFTGVGISCLCPGTKIYTNNGIVNIETVKAGDEVITHLGRWKLIDKVIKKQFSGVATKLQITGYTNDTEHYKFVDNHELFVRKDNEWKWIGCEDVKVGDIVGEPIIRRDRNAGGPALTICERVTCSEIYTKKRAEASSDVQRLMGYFLTDGSVMNKGRGIQFDFGFNEEFYVKDVQEILKKNFGKNSTETKHGNCRRLKCYSVGLRNWFKNHCYTPDGRKIYPWDLARVSDAQCLNLLIGLVRGDGWVTKTLAAFGNSNTRLILLAKQLFARLGFAASVSYREPRISNIDGRQVIGVEDEWSVSSRKKTIFKSIADFIEKTDCSNSQLSERIFIEDGFVCGRVQKVEKEEYSGEVYDLQVADDHSFSGPFLTIHNCGAGMTNVSFANFGVPIYSFSIINGGDWIDKQTAKVTNEPISYINKVKMKIDLTKSPTNAVERTLLLQYEAMIDNTVVNIKKGLSDNKKVRFDDPIDVILGGGGSTPNGFEDLFKERLLEQNLPIKIGEITKPQDTLLAVARGILVAAESHS